MAQALCISIGFWRRLIKSVNQLVTERDKGTNVLACLEIKMANSSNYVHDTMGERVDSYRGVQQRPVAKSYNLIDIASYCRTDETMKRHETYMTTSL